MLPTDWFSGEKAFATLSYGWLWAGLYFILVITIIITFMFCQCFERHCFHKTYQVIIVGVTSLFGYIEVITSTLVSIKPSYARCLLQRVYYDTVSSQATWIDLSVHYHVFTPGSNPWLPSLCWLSSSSLILFSLHRPVVFHPICWFCWNCFFAWQGGIHIYHLFSFIRFVDFDETLFSFQGGIHIYHLLIIIIIKMIIMTIIIIIIILIIFREESTSTTCSPPTSPPGPPSSSLFSPWVAVISLIFSSLILVYYFVRFIIISIVLVKYFPLTVDNLLHPHYLCIKNVTFLPTMLFSHPTAK